MRFENRKKIIHVIFILSMISMILTRLTWVQLRETSSTLSLTAQISFVFLQQLPLDKECSRKFPSLTTEVSPEVTLWFKSLGFLSTAVLTCLSPQGFADLFTKYQILAVFWIVILNMVATRMLTGSWLLSVLVGTVLFSRGAFLARIDSISEELLMAFLVSFWLTCIVHFLQTRTWQSFIVANCSLLLIAILHSYAFLLALALLAVLGFSRPANNGGNNPQTVHFWNGFLGFRTASHLSASQSSDRVLSMWTSRPTAFFSDFSGAALGKLRRRLLLSLIIVFAASMGLFLLKGGGTSFAEVSKGLTAERFELLRSTKWLGQFQPHLDAHWAFSVFILLASLGGSDLRGYRNFRLGARVLVFAFVPLLGSYLVEALFSFELLTKRAPIFASLWLREQTASENPLIWFESNILTFGIIGFVHLLIRIQSTVQNYKIYRTTRKTGSSI